MGMHYHRDDLIQRCAANFVAVLRDPEKSAITGQMTPVCGDINNLIQ